MTPPPFARSRARYDLDRSGDVSIKEFVAQLMPKDYPDKNP
jgi:hypothetical protein